MRTKRYSARGEHIQGGPSKRTGQGVLYITGRTGKTWKVEKGRGRRKKGRATTRDRTEEEAAGDVSNGGARHGHVGLIHPPTRRREGPKGGKKGRQKIGGKSNRGKREKNPDPEERLASDTNLLLSPTLYTINSQGETSKRTTRAPKNNTPNQPPTPTPPQIRKQKKTTPPKQTQRRGGT